MTIVDIVIIYLAFGAPLAVYRYFQTRDASFGRRATSSLFTLCFWIPEAIRTGYRHIFNAYSGRGFVSSEKFLESKDATIYRLTSKLKDQLLREHGLAASPFDVREVIDRYVGLCMANRSESTASGQPVLFRELFDVAGRSDPDPAAKCLMRRNRNRIEHHSSRARRDFLKLLESFAIDSTNGARDALALGIELAVVLEDRKAVNGIEAICAQRSDESWSSQDLHLTPNTIGGATGLVMQTAPINND